MQIYEQNERLNDESALRLIEIIDQVELLAKSKERLRTAPDVSSGLDIVLEAVLWGFGLDFGAVLVLDRNANRANVRASRSKEQKFRLDESYPLGTYVELEDLQTKSVTKVVEAGERSIFGAETVQLVPILSGKELYGVLALGSLERNPLDASTIRILESYAELVHTFMFERSITVNPTPEVAKPVARALNLEPGQIYLVKKSPASAFDIFAGSVFSGYEGLCITRVHPNTLRKKYGLEKTPIIWLTGEASEGEQSVKSIQDLSILIARFLDKAKKAVILLDGFEYIVTNNGFEPFIRFLQILKDRVQRSSGVLIAPLLREALEPKELALVERETVTWDEQE